MKRSWLVYGLAFIGGLVVFMILVSFVVTLLIGLKDTGFGKPKIAVLEVKGIILDAQEYLPSIREIRERKDIRAVVLRIDSPGGAVGPVQELFEDLKILREKKPLVVSMGGVAASGGLYLALAGQKIFASPGTITGSIGVMIQLANIEKLLEKVGISAEIIKSGEFKDTGTSVRKLTPEERKYLQNKINQLHEQFVRAITEERRLPPEKVKALANGMIYTGEEALQHGLIDALGNLSLAIEEARKMANLERAEVVFFPPKKGFFHRLLGEATSLQYRLFEYLHLRAFYLIQN